MASVPKLIACLGDADPQVRAAAAAGLGELLKAVRLSERTATEALGSAQQYATHVRAALEPLLALVRDSQYRVRHAACIAIGQEGFADDRVVALLLRSLQDGTVNRPTVAAALSGLGTPGIDALRRIVQEPAKHSVQVSRLLMCCSDLGLLIRNDRSAWLPFPD